MILKRVSARTFVIALALLLVISCQPPANPAIDLGQDVTQVVAVTQPSVHIDLAKLPTAPVVEPAWLERINQPDSVDVRLEEDYEVRRQLEVNERAWDEAKERSSYFVEQRAYPLTTIEAGARVAALQQTSAMLSVQAAAQLPTWQNIGPAPMKNSDMGLQPVDVSGRVTALAIDPRDGNVVYLGAAQGGVWKTTNGGASWTPLTDGQASLAMGALAIDPVNPDTIYAGTGEATLGGDNYYGAGILKSTDGGQNWVRLGSELFTGLGISRIIINPDNPSQIFVAAADTGVQGPASSTGGVFKSNDGGQSWAGALTCQDCQGASDLAIDTQQPNTLYAAFFGFGIYKSINGGEDWNKLTPFDDSNAPFDRVLLTINQAQPQVLYATFHLQIEGQYDGAAVFKTVNGGAAWSQISLGGFNYCGGQCWYSNSIAVHPTNADILYLGGMADYGGQTDEDFSIRRVVVRTNDSGNSWTDLSPNDTPARTLHPDMHAIAFDPQEPSIVWVGNDGGVWRSTNGGNTWENKNTNLATLQFTGIAIDQTNRNILQGGMQDNNKAYTSDGGASPGWVAADAGDGGFAAIDPFNPNIFYGTRFGKSFQRNDQGIAYTGEWPVKTVGINQSDRSLFYPPLTVDPSTAGVVYFGTNRLYRSTNRGESWQAISPDLTNGGRGISTIAVAPSNPQVVYTGASDGTIQVTTNLGGGWTDVTRSPLPNRFVAKIVVNPANAQVAYAVFNGFDTHTPGSPGHVFKTSNGGATWQNISSNLPDVPTLAIVLDKRQANTLYIGTDTGVFRTTNDGQGWEPFNNGLPNVAVVDLVISGDGEQLIAATHGRSIFRVAIQAPNQNPTPTPTITTAPGVGDYKVYLSAINLGDPNAQPPTHTATSTATPTSTTAEATNTPTATRTPVTPEGTQLPTGTPTLTPTNTPIPTKTATPTATSSTPNAPTPTATATSSPTPAEETDTFVDNFGNANSGWEKGTSGNCTQRYSGGKYEVSVLALESICLAVAPADPLANGAYQVQAAKSSGNDGSIYGLAFGIDDAANTTQFYAFWIDADAQEYALQKFDNGAWSPITLDPINGDEWVSSSAINTGGSTNLLKVRRRGGEIRLSLHGVRVHVVADNSLADNGLTGVINWSAYNAPSALTRFDNFRLDRFTEVYADDYSQSSSGWYVDSSDVCQADYSNGVYRTATQPDYICVYGAPSNGQRDGFFEVQVQREESFYETAYGLIFAITGDFDTFYAFLIIADTQEYALAKYDSAVGWTAISFDPLDFDAWIFSSTINPSTAVNHVAVERDGIFMALFVNGAFVDEYYDLAPLDGTGFGVINWSSQFEGAIADFDSYRVTAWGPGDAAVSAAASVPSKAKALALPAILQPPADDSARVK